jgi:hypothetical protein
MDLTECFTNALSRASGIKLAIRFVKLSRRSSSRKIKTPAFELTEPPVKSAITFLQDRAVYFISVLVQFVMVNSFLISALTPVIIRLSPLFCYTLGAIFGLFAQEVGVTLNTVCQCAWGLLLSLLTQQKDVLFGMTLSGRHADFPGAENVVGLMINTVPCRFKWSQDMRLNDVLPILFEQQLDLMPYQYLGLSDIQRTAGIGDLFDVYYVFQNYPTAVRPLTTVHEEVLEMDCVEDVGHGVSHYPLGLTVLPTDELTCVLGYRVDVIDESRMRRVEASLLALFRGMVSDPSARLIDLIYNVKLE